MELFQTEFWSILCNLGLIAEMGIFIGFSAPVVKKNLQENHPFRRNIFLAVLSLGVFAFLLFAGILFPRVFDPLIYYPYNYYAFFGFFAWLVVTYVHIKFFTWLARRKAIKNNLDPNNVQISEAILLDSYQKYRADHPESLMYDIEFQRKLIHITSILFLLPFVIGPTLYYFVYTYVYAPYPELYSQEILVNIYRSSSYENLSVAIFSNTQTILVALLIAIVIQFVGEIYHNRAPDVFYPLRKSFLKCLRKEELGSFGSHVSMTVGYLMAVTILIYNIDVAFVDAASNAIIATILATIFGDLAASGVGRRWGTKKWKFYPKKSYIGTVAGVIITILVTFPFIGFLGALIAIVIFVITDVILAKYQIADNFAFPVLTAILLRLSISSLTLPLVLWSFL
jgi:dolichol kinase